MEIKASVLFCGDRRESSSSFSSSSSKRMNGEDVQLSRPAAHECRNIPSRDTFPSSSSLCARPFPFFNALVSLVFYVYEKLPNHGDENSRQLGEFVIRPTERKKRNFFFSSASASSSIFIQSHADQLVNRNAKSWNVWRYFTVCMCGDQLSTVV